MLRSRVTTFYAQKTKRKSGVMKPTTFILPGFLHSLICAHTHSSTYRPEFLGYDAVQEHIRKVTEDESTAADVVAAHLASRPDNKTSHNGVYRGEDAKDLDAIRPVFVRDHMYHV